MKILSTLAKAATGAFIAGVEKLGTAEVEKRDGVFVARYLDPLNAKKWHDWAVRHGIPNPVPPEEMHVTVIGSTVDVKMPRIETAMNIGTGAGYDSGGAFVLFGPEEASLVYAFTSWELYFRHETFLRHGAQPKWPNYRPHLTLSNDAAGFELSDDALADVPAYIVLGPEVNADLKAPEVAITIGEDEGDDVLVIVIDLAKAAAEELLKAEKENPTLSVMDAYALADVSKGRVTRGVAKSLAATDWAPETIKDLAKAKTKVEPVLKSAKVRFGLDGAALAELQKHTKREDSVLKSDEDRRLVWSIASVSTVKGEPYYDVEDEHFTTRALEEFAIELTKSGGAGKMEHQGDACNRIVQAMVLSDDLQKSLGIDLGMEPLVICTEVHPDNWDDVKKGGFSDSIAGTFYYYEDDADAA